jgi:FtsP/CotA-like multicopper oxidase with cupredoxin domain
MGLYGNLIVDALTDNAWPAVNREAVVTLDDVLLNDGQMVPFRVDGPTHTAMGRFGNVMLTGGSTDLRLGAHAGEVVRFFFTNTANTRIFKVSVPDARMKLVGGDSGLCELEEWIDSVLLARSERAVVDVLFDAPGTYPIEHRTPDRSYRLGVVDVADAPAERSLVEEFDTLRSNPALTSERSGLEGERERPPDKTLVFTASMPLLYGDAQPTASSYVCPMHPESPATNRAPAPSAA